MPRQSLSPSELKALLLHVADCVIAAEPQLSDADRQIGDGDHGLGMQRGMEAAKEKLAELDDAGIDKCLTTVGMALMSSMGGASGIVFGTLFRGGGKGIAGCEAFTSEQLSGFLTAACEAVMQRGKAKPGDKTAVDALHAAAEAAKAQTDQPLDVASAAVAAAAQAGADSTCDMVATVGRAKSLGERSLGHPDPGALSVVIICKAIAEFAAGESN